MPTGQLNQWLTALVQATPHPVRGGRAPRVLFATQAGVRPPRFVLFTTGPLDAGYQRFVERKLREEFGFQGSPVEIVGTAPQEDRPRRAGQGARLIRSDGRPPGGCRPAAPLSS